MNESEQLNLALQNAIQAVNEAIALIFAPGYEIDDKNKERLRELAQYAPE